jgi:hypothetical protein
MDVLFVRKADMKDVEDKQKKWAFDVFRGDVVDPDDDRYERIIKDWCDFLKKQSRKGLVPLFVTGSGASMGEKGVPSLIKIVDELENIFKENPQIGNYEDISKDFDKYDKLKKGNKLDRTIIASLLTAFQEKIELRDMWKEMNSWLLDKIVSSDIPDFFKNLAKFYMDSEVNAISLTLNFDGLLIRYLLSEGKRAFSLPDEKECTAFFLRSTSMKDNHNPKGTLDKEYIEIQARGDILYVSCLSEQFCPNKINEKKYSLWAHVASLFNNNDEFPKKPDKEELIRCPHCGEKGVSFLSFPGSFEKEKDMQKILSVVWKYLAFRISSVTVVGLSGAWDPLIVAFLGDLLSERDIPLLVVDPGDSKTHIIKELVDPELHPSICIKESADEFSKKMAKIIEPRLSDNKIQIRWERPIFHDNYWHSANKRGFSNIEVPLKLDGSEFEELLLSSIRREYNLDRFAQIGLKSYWLGLLKENIEKHNRLNHSIGVMHIATYLYDQAFKNSKIERNDAERQFLRIAALLHDVGHLPFSHLIEHVFNELNWRPGRYRTKYSHVLHTEENINELFKKDDLFRELRKIDFDVKDIINLVNGCFGVGYLDAIINSPIDADKIDYIFRDSNSTEKKMALQKNLWVEARFKFLLPGPGNIIFHFSQSVNVI